MSLRTAIITLYRKAGAPDQNVLKTALEVERAHADLEAYEAENKLTPFVDDEDVETFGRANEAIERIQEKIRSSALPISKSMRDDFAFLLDFVTKAQVTANKFWENGPELERMVIDVTERIQQSEADRLRN